jgi:hypothetical protein
MLELSIVEESEDVGSIDEDGVQLDINKDKKTKGNIKLLFFEIK